MAITKEKKEQIVKELSDKLDRRKSLVFTDFSGIKVKDLSELKRKLKSDKSELKVAKKTLMDIAFKSKGIDVSSKDLQGEIALAIGYEDEIVPAKIVYEFSKAKQNLKILGAYLENKFYGPDETIRLAQLPSKKELLANMVGNLSSPLTGLASVLQGNIRGLLMVLSGIKKDQA